ncbi:hypothetical protein V9T40_005015 [Parthenolecanium corni]|uniref:Anaphase-promoting complex subunit 7 n=1 Tax=Parthenolecanium corni TaxID=536013 RepID=A0AAN9TRB2_9HEMI
MNTLFEHLKQLRENELHSNVIILADLLLSIHDNAVGMIESEIKLNTLIYYGEAAYTLGKYRKAEKMYSTALQYRKYLIKSKGLTKQLEGQKDILPDSEIKFRLHNCYLRLNMNDQAIQTLQSIPARQRTPKINMALANLYRLSGNERSAITAYKEVLRECPLALEATEGLLKLGVKNTEVNTLVMGTPQLSCIEWLNLWIKAYASSQTYDYSGAIAAFQQLLEESSPLRNNALIMVALGETYYYSGDVTNAKIILQQAFTADPTCHRGYGIMSTVYLSERAASDLEKMMPLSWHFSEDGDSEMWTALACLLYSNNSLSTAAYFAQRACLLNPKNVEGLVVKGCILYDMKKYQNAIGHFREAFEIAPCRYEPHKGLVDCYLAQNRTKEALTIASNCCKADNNSPRALTLYALVLMKEPTNSTKAKALLEKALNQNDTYLPAVYLLAQVYEEENSIEPAINLLLKQINKNPTAKLHQMLADLFARSGEDEKACAHYHVALRLEPNNHKANDGLNRLEHNMENADTSVQPKVGLSYVNSSSDTEGGDNENTYEIAASDSDHYMSDD